jgi:hypothetical protein
MASAVLATSRMTAGGTAGALDVTISRHTLMAEVAVEIAVEVMVPVGVIEKPVAAPIAVIERTVSAVIEALVSDGVSRIGTIRVRPRSWRRPRRAIGHAPREHDADR